MLSLSNKQVRINNRKIILADTPESRLLHLDYRELDMLSEIGVNAVSCTLFGGDIKSISPFISNNPANGIDFVKLASWNEYIFYANEKGIVPFLMLSEKENHFTLSVEQEKEMIQALVIMFGGRSVIFTKEEYPSGNNARLREVYTTLKNAIQAAGANHLIAAHNNTDQIIYTGNNDLIDLVQLQTKLATGKAQIQKAYDAGFAVFQSELVGGVTTGNAVQWCNLNPVSSGAGAFFAADDLKAPQYVGDNLKYEAVYKLMVSTLSGTTPPPTTKPKVKLRYNQEKVNVIVN